MTDQNHKKDNHDEKNREDENLHEIKNMAKRQISDEFEEAEVSDKSEVISSKKVIYIEIDDEVTSVYDKIKNLKIKHIYIVAPRRAVLFQSIVNLKILKRKAEDSGKVLYLITNDKNGLYLAQQVGVPVYDKVSSEGKPIFFSSDDEDEKLRITPLKASVNSATEEAPTRRTEKKISISQLLTESRRRGKALLNVTKMPAGMGGHGQKLMKKERIDGNYQSAKKRSSQEKKEEKIKKNRLVLVAPNKQALIGLGVVSVLVLMVIFYIALPGVTLFITPTASVLEKSVNVTLADSVSNQAELNANTPHMIGSQKIVASVERTVTHFATGKKASPNATNAAGNITIINRANYSWPLVAETRFQTNEGLVYRVKSSVNVPAGSAAGPGKTEAYIVADLVDAYGQVIGERGNIGPANFFVPGLRESSRSLLYAESTGNMEGGVTDFITYVTEEDIEAAKGKLRDVLYKSVEEDLSHEVSLKNDVDKTDYVLLSGEGAIVTGDVSLNPVASVEGQDVPQFEVSGALTASGYAYSQSEMFELLTQELLLKKSPQKKLVRINENSVTYRIFERDSVSSLIKLTANIKGIEEFDIDPSKENGARLLQKIKEHILGKEIEEAKNYIQNLPEVNKVEIESWPAWSPTIPTVPDNIDVEIRNAVMVD